MSRSYLELKNEIESLARVAGIHVPELVAISKTKPISQMLELFELGHRVFGENYVQECVQKSAELRAAGIQGLRLHFVGHLQRNKVKGLLPHVEAIHAVDSIRLLDEIEKQAVAQNWDGGVFFQINLDLEATKSGIHPDQVAAVVDELRARPQRVRRLGLMAIPNPNEDPMNAFKKLQALRDQYGPVLGTGLSMGMSGDYPQAIACGATHLRLGSILFGPR
jgi:pyridoxal phosphate enzyme (YggS family)